MRYLFLCSAILLLGACSNLETVEKRNADGVVIERYFRDKQDSTIQGQYEVFADDGELVEQANYKDGRLDGVRTLYYPGGKVQYTETHVGGEFQGEYKTYYPEGGVQLQGQYVNNIATGDWTGYYPNGERKEVVTFTDNVENGPFKEWYSNGNIKAEGTYKNGDNEDGELILYDLQGEIQKRMHCEAGVCRTVYEANTVQADGE